MNEASILKIAIPSPLRKLFDYLPPVKGADLMVPGMRVKVSFGRRTHIGFIVEVGASSTIAKHKLKRISLLLDREPLFSVDLWKLLLWSASYYHYSLGEVLARALPKLLRNGEPAQLTSEIGWQVRMLGEQNENRLLGRAPKQRAVYQKLCDLHDQNPKKSAFGWHELQSLGIDKTSLNLLLEKKSQNKGSLIKLGASCVKTTRI